uniref:cytoplasmic 60S subunit biogenesis factor REI1 homolog 1-like n=1 Tax=Erigeron canadensis TaxID=72917 RepID=UPI001CB9BA41|nr:cytoplasmic 60S subunit biogenesis factor REI1 homolog 1-like [Erigeron canadensis]
MGGKRSSCSLMCKECNKEFMEKKDEQKHYKSEWHRYNLKRKMAGLRGVTEAVFLAAGHESAPLLLLDDDHDQPQHTSKKKNGPDHAQHLKSRPHTTTTTTTARVSQADDFDVFGTTTPTVLLKSPNTKRNNMKKIDGVLVSSSEDYLDDDEVDPTCCFMCDQKHKSVESCMIHLHKQHGLFIPDIEYLKDPQGLLTYLGQKVKREYTCLYCNINCQPFKSLEAVRMHMVAKSHCRVHYGDATDEAEEPELDEFYDYSSSYVDGNGKQQLVTSDGISNSVTLGCGGSELVITRESDDHHGVSTKALGSREYLRYYRQKPRPSPKSVPVTSLQAAKYRSISLSTVQLKEKIERMVLMKQIMRQMNSSRAETMQCKMSSMRCNSIRNLRPMNALH